MKRPNRILRMAIVISAATIVASSIMAQDAPFPRVIDSRLQINLFAEDPDIVTPIGMAISTDDRIFVIESHTHLRSKSYSGPTSDRIKVFVDQDNDGQFDQQSVFADGLREAMNLAFSPDGELYVVCARSVIHLPDENHDGIADRHHVVLKLETQERYAHNSLLGITFDKTGRMYVAKGNTGSHAYRIVGPDESLVEGYGDGGSIIRCNADGSQLVEFATGFWNPFDLTFDAAGRLLVVDNDPDARGPNRLLQAVLGGDYGYKSIYGGAGTHPFQGWEGELPGTLPYLAGTGEAPSGLIDCRRTSLPTDYENSVLVTIWNENSIERFQLSHQNGTLVSTPRQPIVVGDKNFRPVAFAVDSLGNLFVTDWMLVDYPNHGKGRIWRISPTASAVSSSLQKPLPEFSTPLPDPVQTTIQTLHRQNHPLDEATLTDALQHPSSVVRHAAVMQLSNPKSDALLNQLRTSPNRQIRLAAVLAQRRRAPDDAVAIRRYLVDADVTIRQAALIWAGESMQTSLLPELQKSLEIGTVTPMLLETYLAAVECLQEDFVRQRRQHSVKRSADLVRTLPPGLEIRLAQDVSLSPVVRAILIAGFSDELVANHTELLSQWLQSEPEIQVATIRRIANLDTTQRTPFLGQLISIANDEKLESSVRADALFALAHVEWKDTQFLVRLLTDTNDDIAIEAARTLRSWLANDRHPQLESRLTSLVLRPVVAERLQLRAAKPNRSEDEWRDTLLSAAGSEERGRRVFLDSRSRCRQCHSLNGKGGALGPDLSHVAKSKSKAQIVDAILHPSNDFAPQYQAWIVHTSDGKSHRGLQLDHKSGGAIVLTLDDGSNHKFSAAEIEDYEASPTSLMPSGLLDLLTPGEAIDLVTFLAKSAD